MLKIRNLMIAIICIIVCLLMIGCSDTPPVNNMDSNGSVIIEEFSDFQCPACGASQPIIKNIVAENDLKLVFRHFPLSFHKNAVGAALASECAREQDKFWQMHDVMFANQKNLEIENLKEFAIGLGLDSEQFDECLDSEKYKQKIDEDIQRGRSIGIRGTPSFYVNGKLILGAKQNDY